MGKLRQGKKVRNAASAVIDMVMKSGAKGCEVTVAGKLSGQRAKTMKFKNGYMISSGQPKREFIEEAKRHVLLRQGALGIKVSITKPYVSLGENGFSENMPDHVVIKQPKVEEPL